MTDRSPVSEHLVVSSLDGSREPVLFAPAGTAAPAPLVVALHTWSFDRTNQVDQVLPFARARGWHVLFPEFRGPNLTSNPRAAQACASELALRDVVDAVAWAKTRVQVQPGALFLLGGSGGGHMALMLAAHRPELWDLVCASCPITDLLLWHGQNAHYRPHIEACCGGPPDTPERRAVYQARSPFFQPGLIHAAVHIAHGKRDLSVPFTHSLALYNRLIQARPDARAWLDIFDGGHELHYEAAFARFDRTLPATPAHTGDTLSR